ncbi:MAG TPA: curli assembly protein CsgF [Dyella sp.]|uniref:curli assembly protein CsgF n=1 Tax=Dyella sp. TaxID=1869338 RepID=UPI002D79C857|nr:curli assembly protein CsgF [Dyella sp.]HET6555204.1 curli assembly protein CsgF [Dyella sp.]
MHRRSAFACLLAACSGPAVATTLVYTPVNPNFGGSPLNGPNLLNEANAQNYYKNPGASGSAGAKQLTPLQQFQQELQQAVLSRIAQSVTGGIVNAQGQLVPGTIQTSDFIINISQVSPGVLQITTTDKSTGQTTSFQVSDNNNGEPGL